MTKNEEINIVYKAMKSTKEIRMYKRYQTIYWRLKGKTLFKTADIVGVSRRIVDNYWAKYKEEGLQALKPKKQPGVKKRLTDKQEDKLVDMILNKTPVDMEFPASFNLIIPCLDLGESYCYNISGYSLPPFFKVFFVYK